MTDRIAEERSRSARTAPVSARAADGSGEYPSEPNAGVGGEQAERAIAPITIRAAAICLLVSIAVAAIAYGVGKLIPATYQSYGLIRVALPAQLGNGPVVTAANDTATQYAQLASSQPVAALAAGKLAVSPSSLNGEITGSTVGAQNLVQVTVTADSRATATARAAAASASLQQYLTKLNAQESAQYVANVQRSLGQVNQELTTLTGRLATDSPSQHATDTLLIQSLTNQHDQLLGQIARDAASNQPSLQVVETATPATTSSPKPVLYALVAFIVAAIVAGRVAFVLSGRRRAR